MPASSRRQGLGLGPGQSQISSLNMHSAKGMRSHEKTPRGRQLQNMLLWRQLCGYIQLLPTVKKTSHALYALFIRMPISTIQRYSVASAGWGRGAPECQHRRLNLDRTR